MDTIKNCIYLQCDQNICSVFQSNCCQKNIGAQFTHLHVPSLCKEFFVMRHNIGHSNKDMEGLDYISSPGFLGLNLIIVYLLLVRV